MPGGGDASQMKAYRWKPGQSGNPGGRPKSAAKLILEKLGQQGMAKFTDEIVKHIELYVGEKTPPDDVMWLLERIWPKVSHVNVADTTQRTEAPAVDDMDEFVSESTKMLANLASPNIDSDLPVLPGTEVTKQ